MNVIYSNKDIIKQSEIQYNFKLINLNECKILLKILMKISIIVNVIIFGIINKIKTIPIEKIKPIIETNLLIRTNQKKRINLIKRNIVHVSYSMDKKYYIPIIVSMTSVMESQKNSTFIHFHILCMNDVTIKIKNLILELKQDYSNCEIFFYNMNNSFDYAKTRNEKPKSIYYPLKLPDILPMIKKVIFLDGDTLTFKDLSEFYNLNITNKYYLGMLDANPYNGDGYKKKIKYYINSGVLLCNLQELRKDNMTLKFDEWLKIHHATMKQHDQTVINVVANEKNSIFPPKYCTYDYFKDIGNLNLYLKRTRIKLDPEEVKKSRKDPYILHYIVAGKPWRTRILTSGRKGVDELWSEIAKKSRFIKLINDFINGTRYK